MIGGEERTAMIQSRIRIIHQITYQKARQS
jgi:hypothetical protein